MAHLFEAVTSLQGPEFFRMLWFSTVWNSTCLYSTCMANTANPESRMKHSIYQASRLYRKWNMCMEKLGHSTLSIWQHLWCCWSSHSNWRFRNQHVQGPTPNLRMIFGFLPCLSLLTVVRSNQIRFCKPVHTLMTLSLEPYSEQF